MFSVYIYLYGLSLKKMYDKIVVDSNIVSILFASFCGKVGRNCCILTSHQLFQDCSSLPELTPPRISQGILYPLVGYGS